MSTVAHVPPTFQAMTAFRRFSVAEYQKLIDTGILTDEDRVELLEGHLVMKMPANPPHDAAMTALDYFLQRMLPVGYLVRCQHGSDFPDSRPEPDIAVVRGDLRSFRVRHPEQAEMALVIEVSDSSLARDRLDKGRIYARASIPEYWVVNLVDRQIEVYTDPTGPVTAPVYRRRQDHPPGASVPVTLDGGVAGTVAVSEVLG
ncbi:MAG: Uma2 family endonuclease [Gemmataceae bacterium]